MFGVMFRRILERFFRLTFRFGIQNLSGQFGSAEVPP